jgi:hypothetical protein
MKQIFSRILLLSLLLIASGDILAGDKFVVAKFSSAVDEQITNRLRSSFIKELKDDGIEGVGIESLGQLPAIEKTMLGVLNARGYKYLVRGRVIAVTTRSKVEKVYSNDAKATVDKTVYAAKVYLALSYVNTETGIVDFSTAKSLTAERKDSEREAIEEASTIYWAGRFLPDEYTDTSGKVLRVGEAKKGSAKTVFAVIDKGLTYKGKEYHVYESFPSEELGLAPGETLTREIGELKSKKEVRFGETLEMKVSKGGEAIHAAGSIGRRGARQAAACLRGRRKGIF